MNAAAAKHINTLYTGRYKIRYDKPTSKADRQSAWSHGLSHDTKHMEKKEISKLNNWFSSTQL